MDFKNSIKVDGAPKDTVTSLTFSNCDINGEHLLCTSWDCSLKLFDVNKEQKAVTLKSTHLFEVPIFDACFLKNDLGSYCSLADGTVAFWDFKSNKITTSKRHNEPIKLIRWIQSGNLLLTASWDRTVKIWDVRDEKEVYKFSINDKVLCGDLSDPYVVIGVASVTRESVCILNLKERSSYNHQVDFKYSPRSIASTLDKGALKYAVGSHYGSISFRRDDNSGYFSFKCHRDKKDGITSAYAVNSVKFSPISSDVLLSGGSNGTVCEWDLKGGLLMSESNRAKRSINCATLNSSAQVVAYNVAYDWSKGATFYKQDDICDIYVNFLN